MDKEEHVYQEAFIEEWVESRVKAKCYFERRDLIDFELLEDNPSVTLQDCLSSITEISSYIDDRYASPMIQEYNRHQIKVLKRMIKARMISVNLTVFSTLTEGAFSSEGNINQKV